MVTKCEINDRAVKIISKPYSVRAIVTGERVVFSVNDILHACGIKAPRKWVERNADKFPWMWADTFPYPTKTVKGWRTNRVVFVSGTVGQKLVRLTSCSEPIRSWLLDEVFTYYPNRPEREDRPLPVYEESHNSEVYEFPGRVMDFDNNGFSESADDSDEQENTMNQEDFDREDDIGIDGKIDKIILDVLDLDRKAYGAQIDRILLGLLDLKRTHLRFRAS